MTGAIDRIRGRVHRLGDNVDTDAIIPGRYLAMRDPAALGAHCLEDLDPEFRGLVHEGDILVAGRNFGTGSSREQAVVALKAVGIRGIVVASAARIFFRNAINLGLPVMIAPDAAAGIEAGRDAELSVASNMIRAGGRDLDGAAARRRGCGHSRLWRADGAHASDSRGPIRITTRGEKWLTPG